VNVFVDTSALLALLADNDTNHAAARQALHTLETSRSTLVSTNYIIVETVALTQRRLGMAAVRTFIDKIVPLLQIEWIDTALHNRAIHTLLVANRRRLSLADCASLEVMHQLGISTAFVFDAHFQEQGFTCIP
jgi:predicted nucleic acid-binding protein